MVGYTTDETSNENMNRTLLDETVLQRIHQKGDPGVQDFVTYYTTSLKDLASVNIASTRYGMPIWEASAARSQRPSMCIRGLPSYEQCAVMAMLFVTRVRPRCAVIELMHAMHLEVFARMCVVYTCI